MSKEPGPNVLLGFSIATGRKTQPQRGVLSKCLILLVCDSGFEPPNDPGPLAVLRYGVSQAVARLLLTHRAAPAGGWRLDTLLVGVGIDPEDHVALWNRRREVRRDADGLAGVGIIVRGDRVERGAAGREPVTHARVPVTDARGGRILLGISIRRFLEKWPGPWA